MAKRDVQNALSYGITPNIEPKYRGSINEIINYMKYINFFQGKNENMTNNELVELFTKSVEGLEDSEETKSELIEIFSEPENIQSLRQIIKENATDIEHLLHGFRQLGKVLKIEKKIKECQKQIDEIKLKQYEKGSNLDRASKFIHDKIHKLENEIKKLEEEKEKLLQTKEIVSAYEFYKIATYSHLLREGKLVYTPSVLAQKKELFDKVTEGNSVLLSGPVGTGKTRIAKDLYMDIVEEKYMRKIISKAEYEELKNTKLTYEEYLEDFKNLKQIPIVNGNEETSFRELNSRPIQMSNKSEEEEVFKFLTGLLTKSLKYNLPLIIDEANRTPANFLSSLKKYRAATKGERYKDEITGESFELQGPLQVILTANEGAKYAAHTQKFQDQIKREFTREYIGYFPEDEMYDMLKAKLYNEPGIAYVQREDLEKTLPYLINAVTQVNELYLKGLDYSLKGESTSSVKIKGTVFDTRRFLKLVDRYEIGTENTFLEELNKSIVKFISNEVDEDTDRKILCQIFGAKGLIWKENIPAILCGNTQLQQSDLSSFLASTKNQALNSIYGQYKNGERFLNPRQLATGYGMLESRDGKENKHRLAHFEGLDRDDKGTKIKAFKKSINQLFNPMKDGEIVSMMENLNDNNLDDFIGKALTVLLNKGNKESIDTFMEALKELSPNKYKEAKELLDNGNDVDKQTNDAEKTQNFTEIDTPSEVIEFRKGFVDGIRKSDDVTEEKLKTIVKIGEQLENLKAFHFEKTGYGEMGVLELGGKTMKFLNIAHPQQFNSQLTNKIRNKSLKKNYDYEYEIGCRCKNIQDLVYNAAMPGGSKEDAGIVELIEKIKQSTGVGQLSEEEMKCIVYDIFKGYCTDNGVCFGNEYDYMLLYMYLMGGAGGYGWRWLSDLKGHSRSFFHCSYIGRGFSSYDNVNNSAFLFLGLLV